MRCARVKEELSAFLDEELTAQETAELRAHLEGCADCRAELEALRATVDSVRKLPRATAPAGFRESLMAKIKEAPAVKSAEIFRVPMWRRLWPVAAALLFAVLISQLYPTDSSVRKESRGVASQKDSPAQDITGGKLQPAIAEGMEKSRGDIPSAPVIAANGAKDAYGKSAGSDAGRAEDARLLAKTPEPDREYVDNADREFAKAFQQGKTGEATIATAGQGKAIGKGGAGPGINTAGETLLAKGSEQPGITSYYNVMPSYSMTNEIPDYFMKQQTDMPVQAKSGTITPVEIVIASANPDRARQTAQELLEKRGWLAKAETPQINAPIMAKGAPVPPRTIQLNLPPDQVEPLRQELTKAGLIEAVAMRRNQAVQRLQYAVRLEEEKSAADQTAPTAPATQQTAQRSPEIQAQQQEAPQTLQQDEIQQQRAEIQDVAPTVVVLLQFITVAEADAKLADINRAASLEQIDQNAPANQSPADIPAAK